MILLCHSYFLAQDAKQRARMKPYPPLSTLLTASLLRGAGHPVSVFDATFAPGAEAFEAQLDRSRPAIVVLIEDNFNFLTKMCTTARRDAALSMIAAARARNCKVVVNGPDVSDNPGMYLAAGAHAIALGEGEAALLDVVDCWTGGDAPLDDTPGLILPGPDGARTTAHRRALQDLDQLPHPAWDLIDISAYRQAWLGAHGAFSWNIATSRGCPYACNWCAKGA